jgi:sulfoxide reductase heme-binding subunit YedZ
MMTDKRTMSGNPISTYLRRNWFWLAANLAAALPLLVLLRDFAQDNLGVDPINTINNATGRAAIALLLLSLAATPLHTIFGFRRGLTVRKSLGLWAFAYASFHLLNFVGLDYGFDVQFLLQDALLNKPYIVAGLAALLILLPLAITSTRGWMRRLGRNWKRLHRLVYAAGVLAVLHFLWQAKAAERGEPLLYGLALALLLLVRIPALRQRIIALRQRIVGAPPQSVRRTPAKSTRQAANGAD